MAGRDSRASTASGFRGSTSTTEIEVRTRFHRLLLVAEEKRAKGSVTNPVLRLIESGKPPHAREPDRMEIRFLSLRTADLSAARDFYQSTLQLPLLAAGNDYAVFRAGSTQLMFEASATPEEQPFYHFAVDIPRNQLDSATAWLSSRVALLERDGQQQIAFEDWNAAGIYFHDPSGSIVELIARYNLANDAEGDFSPNHLLRVSEIGWPVLDVTRPGADFQLPTWRDYGKFRALGSETGLILLVPNGRGWLPTNRPAEAHPISLVIADDQGTRHYTRL